MACVTQTFVVTTVVVSLIYQLQHSLLNQGAVLLKWALGVIDEVPTLLHSTLWF